MTLSLYLYLLIPCLHLIGTVIIGALCSIDFWFGPKTALFGLVFFYNTVYGLGSLIMFNTLTAVEIGRFSVLIVSLFKID